MSERRCVLKGQNIGLGVLRREDVPVMAAWFENLEYGAYLGSLGRTFTLEAETAWFEEVAKSTDAQAVFGIIELETSRLVGTCSLFDINAVRGTATLGIGIGEPDCWNKGYGTQAVRLLVEYGMFYRNLFNINLAYVDFNARGARAYEKAGFKPIGRRRGAVLVGGQRFDEVLMDITRDEVDLSAMQAMVGLLPQQ